jgi:hypothetical protein
MAKCDYFIQVYLEIEKNDQTTTIYKLPIIRANYCNLSSCGICDSDEEEPDKYYNSNQYKELVEKMKKMCLTPRPPIVIYSHDFYVSPEFRKKYDTIIRKIYKSREGIVRIVKKESRHPRYVPL